MNLKRQALESKTLGLAFFNSCCYTILIWKVVLLGIYNIQIIK